MFQSKDAESTGSETYNEERHGSFTSASVSIGSSYSGGTRDLKADSYSQIEVSLPSIYSHRWTKFASKCLSLL